MTTRRTDKNRKPPRRPAARPAARPADRTLSGDVSSAGAAPEPSSTIQAAATAPEPVENATIGSAELEAVRSTDDPSERAPEQALAADPVDAPAAVAEKSAAEATSIAASAPDAGYEVQTHPVPDGEVLAESGPAPLEAAAEGAADPEPAAAEPVLGAEGIPSVATADEPAAAATTESEAPERPAADPQEVPLAALQSFIEINGRLVAFMQGEGQAAVAFWKAAMIVRSPGDLAQLQAAEMNRAIDAAIACWTDLARQMGRFASYTPRARAA